MTSKPPATAFPFAGNLLESLELMQKAWGGTLSQMSGLPAGGGLPSLTSMMVPTLDVNELDKRITDLRAVEQWLALNASMLRATIQTLEVQRNTIATLQSLGGAMTAPPSAAAPPAERAFAPPTAASPAGGSPTAEQRKPPRPPSSHRSAHQGGREPAMPNMAQPPLDPTAWWSTLQDQFTRIATAASGAPGAAGSPPKPAARPSRKPRTKPD